MEKIAERYSKKIDLGALKPNYPEDLRATLEARQERAETFRVSATVVLEKCPLCGSVQISPLLDIMGYPYYSCGVCGLVFLQKRLTPSAQDKYWESHFSATMTYANPKTYAYRKEHVSRPKVEYVLDHWDGTPGKWLDLGCGVGDLLSVAAEFGWETLGLEVASESCQFAQEKIGVHVMQANIQSYMAHENAEAQWDVVSAIGYYDLIGDLEDELERSAKLLRPGGLWFMANPVTEGITMRILEQNPDDAWRFIIPPGSTHVFNRKTYEYICQKYGCRIKSIWYFGMDVYHMLNELVLLGQIDPKSEEFHLLSQNIHLFQTAIDRLKLSDVPSIILEKLPSQ